MTRKDFEALSRFVKRFDFAGVTSPAEAKAKLAKELADDLAAHSGNANFDRARFLKAAGV